MPRHLSRSLLCGVAIVLTSHRVENVGALSLPTGPVVVRDPGRIGDRVRIAGSDATASLRFQAGEGDP